MGFAIQDSRTGRFLDVIVNGVQTTVAHWKELTAVYATSAEATEALGRDWPSLRVVDLSELSLSELS